MPPSPSAPPRGNRFRHTSPDRSSIIESRRFGRSWSSFSRKPELLSIRDTSIDFGPAGIPPGCGDLGIGYPVVSLVPRSTTGYKLSCLRHGKHPAFHIRMKPYPKTKPSGVEWLGDVPEHWEVNRLKYSASINDETLPETTSPDFEFEYVDIGSVNAVDGITTTELVVFENAPSRARRKVREGDAIVSTVRTYLRAIAPIKNPPENLIVSTGFAVVRPRKVEPAFLAYALRETSFVESVVARSTGVSYPACNASEVGGISIPLPDPAEQRAIAAFLDRETGRMDALVAKKRELIERLKEKRTALISRTVTRGLPPAAAKAAGLPESPPLKPSGLDWLGEIPEHWEVRAFRHLIDRFEQGTSPNANNSPAAPGELGVLKLGAASKGRFRPEENKSLDEIPSNVTPIFPSRGDLLISRANTPELVGDACVVDVDCPDLLIPDLIYRLRINRSADAKFVCWLLLSISGRAFIEADARGSSASMVKIGQGHVAAWTIPVPPLPEQTAIATYLDSETAKLDALVAKVETAIERLQEYRTALITAAVTGKIDVREEAVA